MNTELNLTETQDFLASVRQSLLDSNLIAQTNKFLYDIKLYICGDYIQVYKYSEKHLKTNDLLCPVQEKRLLLIKNCNTKNSTEKQNEIRADNILRSKLSLQRLVKANVDIFKTFITLTFANNITDIKEANKIFNVWRTQAKILFPELKYVCVPEFQKRGAVHYHLLTNISLNSKLITFQDNKNNCYDVKFWNKGFSSVYLLKNINVVTYISKYITKDIDNRLFSHKRYFYSKNLTFPTVDFLDSNNYKVDSYINELLKSKISNYYNMYTNKITNESINFEEFH